MNKIRVKFYAEHRENNIPSWRSPQPDFNLARFQAELVRRTGRIGSVDRYRVRWAGDKEEYLLEDFDVQTGWIIYENGQETFVSMDDGDYKIPDKALTAPFYENCKVFTPRFVIEEYKEPFYQKAWFIESLEEIKEENGKIDVLSYYREPSETDLQMAEHLRHLQDTLTTEEIETGVQRLKAAAEKEKQNYKEEFIDECAEDFVAAITDGIENKNTVRVFSNDSNFNIAEHSRKIIEAHTR